MYLITNMIMLIFILMSVAFFTLFERKILGYIHLRLGPNKNFFLGLLQPFNDLIKLFSKNDLKYSNLIIFFFFCPLMMVFISMMMWLIFFHWGSNFNLKFFFMVFLCLNGLNCFFFLLPGWTSGSFYSSLGSYRTSSQVISYEGLFFFSVFSLLIINHSYNLLMNFYNQIIMYMYMFLMYFFFIWMCSILAESNRSPFDFAEGESELVSGFNTEYGGGLFSLIFLSEYMSILFLSYITSFIMVGASFFCFFFFFSFLFFYVWVRLSFPRLRYDKLMMLSWKSLMIMSTGMVMMYFFMTMN